MSGAHRHRRAQAASPSPAGSRGTPGRSRRPTSQLRRAGRRRRCGPRLGALQPDSRLMGAYVALLHSFAMAKRVLILGSTGSVGEQALDVVARSPELELAGLSAAGSWERLVEQAREHRPSVVALTASD